MTPDQVRDLVLKEFSGAAVEVSDMTGTSDHFEITVTSIVFAGKTLIDQHKMVFAVLEEGMRDPIHAVKIRTRVPQNIKKEGSNA